MKKLFLLATAAMLVSAVSFAGPTQDKKKKCAKGKTCCQKAKKCSKDKEKETTAEMKTN